MHDSTIFSVILGLLLAAVVYVVGTAITSFSNEGLIWGLVAILVFLAVAFNDRYRGRRI